MKRKPIQVVHFTLTGEHIDLHSLLKAAGIVDSGAAGKVLVAAGNVTVDDAPELRKSAKNLLLIGILPVTGGLILTWALIQSIITLSDPNCSSCSGSDVAGIGLPVVIAGVFMLVGVVLMVAQRFYRPEFFGRRIELVDPNVARHGAGSSATGGN